MAPRKQHTSLGALFPVVVILLASIAVAGVRAAPTAAVTSDDMVVTDGSLLTVTWEGFNPSTSPVLAITLYDSEDSTRTQRWSGMAEMGFAVVQVQHMAVTSSAGIAVCTTTRPRVCAYTSPLFEIMYSPL